MSSMVGCFTVAQGEKQNCCQLKFFQWPFETKVISFFPRLQFDVLLQTEKSLPELFCQLYIAGFNKRVMKLALRRRRGI